MLIFYIMQTHFINYFFKGRGEIFTAIGMPVYYFR